MKVIFLDIDGVMNSHIFYQRKHKRRWRNPKTWRYKLKYWVRLLLNIKPKQISLADYKIPDSHYTFEYQFKRLEEKTCVEKWKWLSEWCNKTNTKICVSSTWKHHFGTGGYRWLYTNTRKMGRCVSTTWI